MPKSFLRFSCVWFLSQFAWVRAMQALLRTDVMYCERCHGKGELLMPGGTVSCPRCQFRRRVASGYR